MTNGSTHTLPAEAVPQPRERISVIDTAKGVGIALVVWGHMVARDAKPSGNEWWQLWHDHLYAFHMAFFFFLSGYVFFLHPPAQWPGRWRKMAAKLIPAYLLFSVVVYLAKFAAAGALHVDRPVQNPLDELVFMLLYPTRGFAQFLWFIPVLLMIQGVVTLLARPVTRYLPAALVLLLALHLLSIAGKVPELFALHQLGRYALFFVLGSACHRYGAAWQSLLTGASGIAVMASFVATLLFAPEAWLPTLAALLSVPALVRLSVTLQGWQPLRTLLQFLGRNTLTIYLMNSLAMGLVRGVVLRFWSWDDWRFFVVAPLLFACGLALPIIVQRLVFARWAWTDRITR